jgi:hypothetical protein
VARPTASWHAQVAGCVIRLPRQGHPRPDGHEGPGQEDRAHAQGSVTRHSTADGSAPSGDGACETPARSRQPRPFPRRRRAPHKEFLAGAIHEETRTSQGRGSASAQRRGRRIQPAPGIRSLTTATGRRGVGSGGGPLHNKMQALMYE